MHKHSVHDAELWLDEKNTKASKALNMLLFCKADVSLVRQLLGFKNNYDVIEAISGVYDEMTQEFLGRL